MVGPVFTWELVRAGRHRWHWWARLLYVSLLLVFLYATFGDITHFGSGLQSHRVMAEIGSRFYAAFSVYQLAAVLILAPVYAANSISEEKTRRTLPYLLASQLRDDEIVLGKIALAVLRVWEVLLCGLPLCALCLLLGGVTPEYMALDFLLAMSAAWASCALGVLVAILSRRLSEGLLMVLLLQMIWYILPVVDSLARATRVGYSLPRELLDMNAFVALYRGQSVGAMNRWDTYALAIGATLACGLAWSLIAWWILRPAWRWEEERGSPRGWWSRLHQTRPARLVWDHPWLWRELRSRRASSIDRVVWALCAAIAVGVLVAIAWHWEDSVAALAIRPARSGMPPASLLIGVYAHVLFMGLLALPYLAILGATALAEERDGGHLDLLCITLLDQRHLVNAKATRLAMIGGGVVLLPLVLQALMLALGWSTIWALVLNAAQCLTASSFWLMTGLALAVHVSKTSRALILALGLVLATIITGPLVMMLFLEDWSPPALSSPPMHMFFLLAVDNCVEPQSLPDGLTMPELRAASLFFSVLYAAGAVGMYCWSLRAAPPWPSASEIRQSQEMALAAAARQAPGPAATI